MYEPGYGTEYTENYCWGKERTEASSHNKSSSGLFKEGGEAEATRPATTTQRSMLNSDPTATAGYARDPSVFPSQQYPSIYRETTIKKDERGHYIDPFKNIATKPYGRRLMYDPTHPDKMYSCQYSSELADSPNCYSFPTTTGLNAELPWTKEMQWQTDGQVGTWPTDLWRDWTNVAECPPYDGHNDQIEYAQYKTQVL